MSTELQKQLTAIGSYLFKGTVATLFAMAVFIFNDMRESVSNIEEKVSKVSDAVIRHDGEIRTNAKDIERLDRTKADRK